MSTRALVLLPRPITRGQIVEVRATVAHPMETGHRRGSGGELLPRDIVRRLEVRLNGDLVFAADMHPALSANPYVAFHLRAQASGSLVLTWRGDQGFAHSETVAFEVA
jgi:sulfur-oxidizing protein SoxZ